MKRATVAHYALREIGMVSIHAPVKGATYAGNVTDVDASFNPRSREGSDG